MSLVGVATLSLISWDSDYLFIGNSDIKRIVKFGLVGVSQYW